MNKQGALLQLLFAAAILLYSCTTTNIAGYYAQNQPVLDHIESTFQQQHRQTAFSLLFTDKTFNNLSIEIVTDSIKYIYEFGINEKRMQDTLVKYHLHVPELLELAHAMQSVHCTWVSNLDYYVDDNKYSLVYMSIKAKGFNFPFTNKKYYILTYFAQPQYYDNEGRLLDHRKRKRLRRINNEIFRRINDRVCYTVSSLFR